jgi:hypothetical protein
MPSHPYKISFKSTNRFKSCAHHRSLNVRYFGMVKATGLSSMESRSPSISSSPHKISSKSTNPFKSNTHLRSLNVRHFGMTEATRLKMRRRCQLEWQYLPTKFHENPPIDSKIICGGHRQTDRQTHTHTHKDRVVI